MPLFKTAFLFNLLLFLRMVHFLALLALLTVAVEVGGEFYLCLDLWVAFNKHGVGELDAHGVLAAVVRIVLVLVVGPDYAAVELLLIIIENRQLNPVNLFLQILLVVIDHFLVQDVNYHFEGLGKESAGSDYREIYQGMHQPAKANRYMDGEINGESTYVILDDLILEAPLLARLHVEVDGLHGGQLVQQAEEEKAEEWRFAMWCHL